MTLPTVELAAQIAITRAYVNTRPVSLVLTPYTFDGDGSGGRKKIASSPRPAQVARFLEGTSSDASTELGSQYTQSATLMAEPTFEIAVNDEFFWDGSTWRVDAIEFPNGYEIRATVLRYGR